MPRLKKSWRALHYPNYKHRITNVSPGLILGEAYIWNDNWDSFVGGLYSGEGLYLGIYGTSFKCQAMTCQLQFHKRNSLDF